MRCHKCGFECDTESYRLYCNSSSNTNNDGSERVHAITTPSTDVVDAEIMRHSNEAQKNASSVTTATAEEDDEVSILSEQEEASGEEDSYHSNNSTPVVLGRDSTRIDPDLLNRDKNASSVDEHNDIGGCLSCHRTVQSQWRFCAFCGTFLEHNYRTVEEVEEEDEQSVTADTTNSTGRRKNWSSSIRRDAKEYHGRRTTAADDVVVSEPASFDHHEELLQHLLDEIE
jgi:hypothetical protein